MSLIKSIFLLTLLFIPFSLSAETIITKSSVNELIQKITHFVRSMDAEKLAPYLTDDISITIESPVNMGGTQIFNKEQYIKHARESFAVATKYTYAMKDIDIKIFKDSNSATVTSSVYETIEINGINISTKSRELFTIVISDGILKINSSYSILLPENVIVSKSK